MSEEFTNNPDEMTDAEQLDKFKLDVNRDANVVDDQRDQANEDMRFVNVTGGMWEGFLTNDFDDERVKLELDTVSNPLQRFLGEWVLNRIGVDYESADDKTSDDDAELLNGIYRSDFRDNFGKMSTDVAVGEASNCGYGAFKLATVFEDDENPENDNKRIQWRPMYNAYNTVFWDQAAQHITKMDARWCTVLKPFTRDAFEDAYPDKSAVSAYTPDTHDHGSVSTQTPDFVYVATRYEAVRKKETVFIYNNLQTSEVEVYTKEDHELIEDELKADAFRTFVRERKIMRRSVMKTVFSGDDILEKTRRIAGKWIPIIPVYGIRTYVDGVEWYRGIVRKLKDAARLYNMQVSQLAENAASSGQEVPIFFRDQMLNEDIKNLWADKNNKPYLLVDQATDAEGITIAAGPIAYSKPPQLDSSTAALLGIVPAFIQDTTGGMPQEVTDPDLSGRAIREMRKIINMTTATITDNIAEAVTWSGEVYQSMASEEYATQRILKITGKDGTKSQTQLFKTVLDSETGKMVQSNTLKGKRFKAFPDAGPQYETMREETVDILKGMLETLANIPGGQQYTPAMLAVLLNNITGVGLEPIKELNRKIMLSQGLVKPETEEEEALVAQMQQPQEDAQEGLIEAATNQQNAEARNLDASATQKLADAAKKEAETVETLTGIEQEQQKIDANIRKEFEEQRTQIISEVRSLPLQ